MSMSLKVIVPTHPLIKHWLSILRDPDTPNILYSTSYEQIGKWLTYEALRDWLPYKKELIVTRTGKTEGVYIDNNYPIRIIAEIPEGLTLWFGSKEVIPNGKLSLGKIPHNIPANEGIILYRDQITRNSSTLKLLKTLSSNGIKSNRILIISCICSNEGLNEIGKIFPEQIIYTSCIDKESDTYNVLDPGIGNPISRLSTMFQEKN